MADAQENHNLTIDRLLEIKNLISRGRAKQQDYFALDYYLSCVNLQGYILQNIRSEGFCGYQDFVDKSKKSKNVTHENSFRIGFIDGIVNQCVVMLFEALTPADA